MSIGKVINTSFNGLKELVSENPGNLIYGLGIVSITSAITAKLFVNLYKTNRNRRTWGSTIVAYSMLALSAYVLYTSIFNLHARGVSQINDKDIEDSFAISNKAILLNAKTGPLVCDLKYTTISALTDGISSITPNTTNIKALSQLSNQLYQVRESYLFHDCEEITGKALPKLPNLPSSLSCLPEWAPTRAEIEREKLLKTYKNLVDNLVQAMQFPRKKI